MLQKNKRALQQQLQWWQAIRIRNRSKTSINLSPPLIFLFLFLFFLFFSKALRNKVIMLKKHKSTSHFKQNLPSKLGDTTMFWEQIAMPEKVIKYRHLQTKIKWILKFKYLRISFSSVYPIPWVRKFFQFTSQDVKNSIDIIISINIAQTSMVCRKSIVCQAMYLHHGKCFGLVMWFYQCNMLGSFSFFSSKLRSVSHWASVKNFKLWSIIWIVMSHIA